MNSEKISIALGLISSGAAVTAWYGAKGAEKLYHFETNDYSTGSEKFGAWLGAYIGVPFCLCVAGAGIAMLCDLIASECAAGNISLPQRPRLPSISFFDKRNDNKEAEQEEKNIFQRSP